MRGNSKKKSNFNSNVVSIVKKELQKRHESPRSRRQLINNLAGPQSYSRTGANPNNVLAGQAGNQHLMNQFSSNNQIGNQSFSHSGQNDLTFFDSQIFANGIIKQRSNDAAARNQNQIIGAKFASKSSDQSQFFNRTGPIKLMHNNNSKVQSQINHSQNQSQHVEDMFNMIDEV